MAAHGFILSGGGLGGIGLEWSKREHGTITTAPSVSFGSIFVLCKYWYKSYASCVQKSLPNGRLCIAMSLEKCNEITRLTRISRENRGLSWFMAHFDGNFYQEVSYQSTKRNIRLVRHEVYQWEEYWRLLIMARVFRINWKRSNWIIWKINCDWNVIFCAF